MSSRFRSGSYLLILPLFLGLFLALLVGAKAQAAAPTGTSLTTTPITLGLNVKPGSTTTQTLKVLNNGTQPVPILMQIKTFGAYGTTGEASITNFPSLDPEASYIHLSPSSFTAQPGVWSSVTATISLPQTASLGYYYAVIFQPVLPSNIQSTYIVKGSNAILLLLDTGSSNEQRQVEIAKFSTSHGLYEYLPASFNVTFHNKGNIYLAPSGDIFISRHSDGTHTIASLGVNSGGGNVLPNSNRTFQASWSDGFPYFSPVMVNGQPEVKNGNTVEKLHWDFSKVNKLRFGKYYARLAVSYYNGSHQILLNSTLSFWVIPWKLMLVALIPLLLFLAGIWLIVRSIVRRIRGTRKNRK